MKKVLTCWAKDKDFKLFYSIIAPTLIHAGADLMIIIPVFASYGVSG